MTRKDQGGRKREEPDRFEKEQNTFGNEKRNWNFNGQAKKESRHR